MPKGIAFNLIDGIGRAILNNKRGSIPIDTPSTIKSSKNIPDRKIRKLLPETPTQQAFARKHFYRDWLRGS